MKRSELFLAFLQLPLDIAMIIAAFVIAYYLRIDLEVVPAFSDIGLKNYLAYSLYLIPFWVGLFALNGLYNATTSQHFRHDFYRILNASSTAMLAFIVLIFLTRSFFFSRLILVFTWVLSILFVSLGRLTLRTAQRYLYAYGIDTKKVILIGDNATSERLFNYFSKKRTLGYKVCGILKQENLPSRHGLKVLGAIDELNSAISSCQADEIILTDTNLRRSKILELIEIANSRNVVFKYVPDLFSIMTTNVTSGLIGSMPVMEVKPTPMDGWGRIVKRIVDIVFSTLAMIILLPVMLIIALLIKLTSKGPVLYAQKRVGRDGTEFKFYKFRSMYAEKSDYQVGGSKWTTKDDEKTRVTPLGRILRKTSLDELPQFYNVLRGDMSFVGPRPEQPKFVQQFQAEIPEYFKRHRVKSGLTGWAQVNGLKGDTSIKERVKYDIYYIENWSFWFDLTIVQKTVRLLLKEALGGKVEYQNNGLMSNGESKTEPQNIAAAKDETKL